MTTVYRYSRGVQVECESADLDWARLGQQLCWHLQGSWAWVIDAGPSRCGCTWHCRAEGAGLLHKLPILLGWAGYLGHVFLNAMAEAQESKQKHMRPLKTRLRTGPLALLHTLPLVWARQMATCKVKGWEGTLCPWWSYGTGMDGGKAEEWGPVMQPTILRDTKYHTCIVQKLKKKPHIQWECA